MTVQVGILHPRKLYAMLRACPSREDRARAACDFLRTCAGASSGFLLLRTAGGELTLAAHTHPAGQVPPGLLEEARLAWMRELDIPHDDNKTKTLELSAIKAPLRPSKSPLWRSPEGEAFDHRLLSTYRGPDWVAVGIGVFERGSEHSTLLRQVHVEAVCNALIDAGDIPLDVPEPAVHAE